MFNPCITKKDFYICLDDLKGNRNLEKSIGIIMRKSAAKGNLISSKAPSTRDMLIELLENVMQDDFGTIKWFIYDLDFGRKHSETQDFLEVSYELYDMLTGKIKYN